MCKNYNLPVLPSYFYDSEISKNTTVPSTFFKYNLERKEAMFGFPESTFLRDSSSCAIDTNTALNNTLLSTHFTFTSGAVAQESSGGILASKVDLVCENDLYEPIKDRWEEATHIEIFNTGTYQLHNKFEIKMSKISNNSGFSTWMFTGVASDGNFTTMLIKDEALQLNVGAKRRADLSLLALMFVFKTASLAVECLSNDTNIINSFKTFKFL